MDGSWRHCCSPCGVCGIHPGWMFCRRVHENVFNWTGFFWVLCKCLGKIKEMLFHCKWADIFFFVPFLPTIQLWACHVLWYCVVRTVSKNSDPSLNLVRCMAHVERSVHVQTTLAFVNLRCTRLTAPLQCCLLEGLATCFGCWKLCRRTLSVAEWMSMLSTWFSALLLDTRMLEFFFTLTAQGIKEHSWAGSWARGSLRCVRTLIFSYGFIHWGGFVNKPCEDLSDCGDRMEIIRAYLCKIWFVRE